MTDTQPENLISAVTDGWGLLALVVICITALAWRFGNKVMDRLDSNHVLAQEAKTEAQAITKQLGKTNHGTENFGEAIDRLTETVWGIRDTQDIMRREIASTSASLKQHVEANQDVAEFGRVMMARAKVAGEYGG